MRFFVTLVLTLLLFSSYTSFSEEKPVEAWISYKQVNGKVVEVVKVRTNTGKVYEFYPGLPPEKIPKPVNKLPRNTSRKLLYISIGFFLGVLAGTAGIYMKYRKT